jgi:hypothetical protein
MCSMIVLCVLTRTAPRARAQPANAFNVVDLIGTWRILASAIQAIMILARHLVV